MNSIHGCTELQLLANIRVLFTYFQLQASEMSFTAPTNDFLFLAARLVAYWPVPIHAVAPLAYTVLT